MAPTSKARTDAGRAVQAAGAVLWRPGPDGPELGLVHRPRYDDWSFPKGKMDPGEHLQLTAVREVFEETGQHVVLGRVLQMIEYPVSGVPKQVRYWAGRALDQSEGGGRFAPNSEVDRLAWVTPGEAWRRLTRRLDATVLDSFLAAPHDTVPIVLLRHATAERRSGAYPDDRIRPLSEWGLSQAEALVDLLDCFGPLNLVSSPTARCVETLQPSAKRHNTAVEIDPALSESAHESMPPAIGAWIRALIAQGRPTVVCSHRPVLDDVLGAVVPPPGAPHGPRIRGRPWSPRDGERLLSAKLDAGSAWILHVTRRHGPRLPSRLVAVDRLRPFR
jgi:8-oxo-dGTP pyrophosphatase MutT (NUDIX family)/phosphohistidine phosphatase SixA